MKNNLGCLLGRNPMVGVVGWVLVLVWLTSYMFY